MCGARQITEGGAMSVPEELKGRKGDMLAARVIAPIVAAIIYGLYEFVVWGASSDFYLYTYFPVFGGVAAIAGLMAYYLRVTSPKSPRSVGKICCCFSASCRTCF
jgi:hypothetical protein